MTDTDRKTWHKALSERVRGAFAEVTWKMSLDEAEEVATFIEESIGQRDLARRDAEALRAAINDGRADLLLPSKAVLR